MFAESGYHFTDTNLNAAVIQESYMVGMLSPNTVTGESVKLGIFLISL